MGPKPTCDAKYAEAIESSAIQDNRFIAIRRNSCEHADFSSALVDKLAHKLTELLGPHLKSPTEDVPPINSSSIIDEALQCQNDTMSNLLQLEELISII